MAVLDTVADYIEQARVLLQDEVEPYRWSDANLVDALNMGLLEVRRLRPDLMLAYLRTTIPQYSAAAPTTDVVFEEMYRSAILYYICGHAQLIDDEATQDARATVFKNKFVSYMLSIQA